MRKSSRRILSAPAGIILIILGSFLMGGYGFFTNFYQAPWFVRFALPAMYYIGSILIGVGLLFFFIRENVWRCVDCKEMTKR
jgi:TRAP-type C4-dicarboxylate transport system permease small subunit